MCCEDQLFPKGYWMTKVHQKIIGDPAHNPEFKSGKHQTLGSSKGSVPHGIQSCGNWAVRERVGKEKMTCAKETNGINCWNSKREIKTKIKKKKSQLRQRAPPWVCCVSQPLHP